MKQAQSEPSPYPSAGSWWPRGPHLLYIRPRMNKPRGQADFKVHELHIYSFGQIFLGILAGAWFVLTLPFRLIFWIIAWAGRLTAILLGFSLMVLGMALWAGPFFFIGIPVFLVGLVLTLRCLD